MTRRIFVDTKWNPKKHQNSKKHVCYDPEKDRFFEVDSLTELKDYDEIYLDSPLFPNIWQQLREIIDNSKKVYYFTRPWKWRKLRERFREELKTKTGKVSKNDEGDSFLLWKVYELSITKNNTHRYFKPLTNIDVEMRLLLMKEKVLYRNLQRVQNASIVGVDVGGDIKTLEKMVEDVRREIVDKATEIILSFTNMANNLGLGRDDINGLTGLAGILVYDKFTSYKKSIHYFGLYKTQNKTKNKKYNRWARRYLVMLTNAILRKKGKIDAPRYRDMRQIIKTIVDLKRQMGLAEEGLGYKP